NVKLFPIPTRNVETCYYVMIIFYFVCIRIYFCLLLVLSTGLFLKTSCYFILIQELKTWTEAQSYCNFNFNYISLTWRDAQRYCRRKYIDLAFISESYDNDALVFLLKYIYYQNKAWIGLSMNLWLWSDQSKVTWMSVKWAAGQPDNASGNEKCGFVHETGLIGDDGCSHTLPFFCSEFHFCVNP
uniref:C-type lectin domain-containing protein n=1 Tax=Sinocyclocheilus anshuiensis TaxID=1608454 RepID=A0A671RZ02_9TELE